MKIKTKTKKPPKRKAAGWRTLTKDELVLWAADIRCEHRSTTS